MRLKTGWYDDLPLQPLDSSHGTSSVQVDQLGTLTMAGYDLAGSDLGEA